MGGWQAFSEAARSYLDSLAQTSAAGASQRFSDFLREQFATFLQSWSAAAAPAGAMPPGLVAAGPVAPSGGFELPAFGATREHQQRAQRMAQAVQRIEAAQRRLQRLWSDVLREAANKFVSQLQPMHSAAAPSPQLLRKLYDGWIDCAEEAYSQVAHGQAFCDAQAELVNATSQWRLEQQANIEHWSKSFDLPTRSEINTLTRRLAALEAQLRETHAAPPKSAASSAPRALRKPPVKRAKRSKKRS
jgi:hypothetical protein